MKDITIGRVIDVLGLEVLCSISDYRDRVVTTKELVRPGLPLAGFFQHFDAKRIQIIGKAENTFLHELDSEELAKRLDKYLQWNFPALIISRGMDVPEVLLEIANKYGRTVLRSEKPTVQLTTELIDLLSYYLAPRETIHGVLMEVNGEGVLIIGESGVGKSETAIELVKRGHRLISDDAVIIKKISTTRLLGTAPELIKHYMELRGVGIIDVSRLFGMSAVKDDNVIDLVVKLEPWQEGQCYSNAEDVEESIEILGVNIPQITIPVKPGRNMAVILEIAAIKERHRKMGFNAAKELTDKINQSRNG